MGRQRLPSGRSRPRSRAEAAAGAPRKDENRPMSGCPVGGSTAAGAVLVLSLGSARRPRLSGAYLSASFTRAIPAVGGSARCFKASRPAWPLATLDRTDPGCARRLPSAPGTKAALRCGRDRRSGSAGVGVRTVTHPPGFRVAPLRTARPPTYQSAPRGRRSAAARIAADDQEGAAPCGGAGAFRSPPLGRCSGVPLVVRPNLRAAFAG